MADITRLEKTLTEQHRHIRSLMEDVKAAAGSERAKAFDQLTKFLAAHEAVEIEAMHLPAQPGLAEPELAGERIAEEDDATHALSRLESVAVDTAEFERGFDLLAVAVNSHAEAEEHEELPALAKSVEQGLVDSIQTALTTVPQLAEHTPEGAIAFATRLEAARLTVREASRSRMPG